MTVAWQPSNYYPTASFVEPPAVTGFGYEATTAGTSGVSEPAWPQTAGGTVSDGTVVWTARTATTITWTASNLYKSGAVSPTFVNTVGQTSTDNGIIWTTRTPAITDPKCPQNKVAFGIASKVYSPYKGVVRYSTTNYPRDWSTQDDAGFLPPGPTSSTSETVTALAEYRGRLAVLTADNLRIWTVDPDPAQNTLFDSIGGIGTMYPKAVTPVSGDLFFVTKLGVRSMSIAAGAENLQTGDVGTPIDALVQAKLAGTVTPIGMYYPGSGQFWLAFDNEVFVYSQSRLGKVGAWSRYVFPYAITAWTQTGGDLYLRSGDSAYKLDETLTADNGVGFEGIVWWPYLDMGSPGTTKLLDSVDIVGYGTCSISIGYNQATTTAYTTPYTIGPDTVPGGRIPMSVAAPSMAVKLVYAPGQSWELLAAALYLQDQRLGT